MAKYTETLHNLLKNEDTNELIHKALSSYPLYQPVHDELYGYIPTREELNKKIVEHYRWYEIGSETVERFLYNLETTMNEIMPYYNQLYKSVDVINGLDDIFGNLDVEETFEQLQEGSSKDVSEGTSKDSSEGNSSSTSKGNSSSTADSESTTNSEVDSHTKNVKSNTPQSNIAATNKDIDSVEYASEIDWNHTSSNDKSTNKGHDTTSNESEQTTTGETSQTSNSEHSNKTDRETLDKLTHTLRRKGNQGVNTYAHDMLEFRELFVNIEQKIIHDPELAKCFMLVW